MLSFARRRKSQLPTPGPDDEVLIDAAGVAALLGVSIDTVLRMRDRGKLPPAVRLGRLVRWRKVQIVEFIRGLAD
jgi:excisionase family DNA binding protein